MHSFNDSISRSGGARASRNSWLSPWVASRSICPVPHFFSRSPYDFVNLRAAFTSAVRVPTSASRARITVRWIQGSQMTPIHLGLLAGRRFEASHGHRSCRASLGVQPVLQNRACASVVTLPQLSQKHLRVPHPCMHPLFQIRLEMDQACWLAFAARRISPWRSVVAGIFEPSCDPSRSIY